MRASACCRNFHHPPGQRQQKEKERTCSGRSAPSARSATGQQLQESQKAQRPDQIGACTDRRAEGHCTGARQRFSLWTVHGPFLFWQDKREMGGASPLDKPPAGAESPWPPDGGPNFHGRFVTSLTRSRGGHTIGPPRAAAPTGARNGFTPARRCAPADNPW